MNRWGLAPAILLALAGVPDAAAGMARDPEVLKLTSKWVVNYDKDSCHLLGEFGTGDDAVIARFTRYHLGPMFDLALIGKRLRSMDATADVTIDFGMRANRLESVLLGKMGELPAVFLTYLRLDGWEYKEGEGPPEITPEQEKAITGVKVAMRTKRPFRLDFRSLGKPMAAMRACQNDLIRSWGYDPDAQSALARGARPLSPPATWLRDSDYPPAARFRGFNGVVQFRLDVDPEGKVAGCHVLARTDPDVFADATCAVLGRRARFSPALDAQQKPVRSYFVSKVKFMMAEW